MGNDPEYQSKSVDHTLVGMVLVSRLCNVQAESQAKIRHKL